MPKQKTKKSVAKRFRKTASGKLKHSSSGRGHLFTSKTGKRKRQLRAGGILSKPEQKRVAHLMPR